MRRFWLFLPLGVFPALLFACGGCGSSSGPTEDPNRITAIVINVTSNNALAPVSNVVLPNATPVTLTVTGVRASGAGTAIDPATVQWRPNDPSIVAERLPDDRYRFTPTTDWFNASGNEPTVTVTARYENLTATLGIRSVINVSGTWTATLGDGVATQKLVLSQRGRTITDAKTGISGTIDGDKLLINSNGFTVDAKFETRDRAVGTFSGLGQTGNFTCTRDR